MPRCRQVDLAAGYREEAPDGEAGRYPRAHPLGTFAANQLSPELLELNSCSNPRTVHNKPCSHVHMNISLESLHERVHILHEL